MQKIAVFPHRLPRRSFERMLAVAPAGMALQKRMSGIPVLVDVDRRFRIMDHYEGYVQVLTLASPPIEVVGDPDVSPDLARLANDEMPALVERHPPRFSAFVASLPMNHPPPPLHHLHRPLAPLRPT